MIRLCLWTLSHQFFLNLCSKLLSVLANYKKSNWFYFLYWCSLRFPKQLQCLVYKTLRCLENIYLEVVAQSSSMKKVFLKILLNLERKCAGVSWKPPTLFKNDWHRRRPVNFEKFLRTYLVKHLRTAASVYSQANTNMEKGLLVRDFLPSHLI